MSETITPVIAAEELFVPAAKEYEATPPGLYRMAIAGKQKVSKTKSGDRQLEVFFRHTEEANKGFKGVNGKFRLEGTDKNGKSLARQFGDFLAAIGIETALITSGAASIQLAQSFDDVPADEQWKGVEASVTLSGDTLDLTGKEVIAKVGANTYNGKTSIRVDGVYPVRE